MLTTSLGQMLSFLFYTFLLISDVSLGDTCSDIVDDIISSFALESPPIIGKTRAFNSRSLVLVDAVPTGSGITYSKVFTTYFYKMSPNIQLEYSRYEQWPVGKNKRTSLSKLKKNRAEVEEIKTEMIDYAISQYEARRSWSKEMLDSLRAKAKSFERGSYIKVRETDSGQIVGSLRLAYSFFIRRYTRDPSTKNILESYFVTPKIDRELPPGFLKYVFADSVFPQISDMRLEHLSRPDQSVLPIDYIDGKGVMPRRAQTPKQWVNKGNYELGYGVGQLIEPGLFAISKENRGDTYLNIYEAFLRVIVDPKFSNEFNRNHRLFYTYNDRPKLYTRMGFELTGHSFSIAGTNWQELRASPGKLLEVYLKNRKTSSNSREIRKKIEQMLNASPE